MTPAAYDALDWTGGRLVRYAKAGATLHLRLSEVTSQGRVYKRTLDTFFRREFRDWRPRYGDFSVEIHVELLPGLPKLDLDNLAKAILDGVKGAVFFDDAQVARLLVERREGAVERIHVSITPYASGAWDETRGHGA
ncbi:MAG: RusA family crossover junction endodeoxyribonuclease [Alphaproteobacteria bacterium]|nr:RusA family crossover junction endodeoxyribonuclease [Alphaproteobacteria bacterium]